VISDDTKRKTNKVVWPVRSISKKKGVWDDVVVRRSPEGGGESPVAG
jgi:hypothetical protein